MRARPMLGALRRVVSKMLRDEAVDVAKAGVRTAKVFPAKLREVKEEKSCAR